MGRWKTSTIMISLGIILVLSGARGVAASQPGHAGLAWSFDRLVFSASATQTSPIFLPPTLQLSPTPTPFNDIHPIPGLPGEWAEIAPLSPAATPRPELDPNGYPPDWISLPSIQLDAPIVLSRVSLVTLQHQQVLKWAPPDRFAAGWQETSAPLGVVGNTVLNGHNNIFGDVFEQLENVKVGDAITVYSGDVRFQYQVTNRMILPELYEGLAVRLDNAKWIEPSEDERLTLVTCWPLNGNSHRLILVARPVGNSVTSPAEGWR